MKFASKRIEDEWFSGSLFPMTAEIVKAGQDHVYDRWGWEFVLTCVWRSVVEDAQYEGSGIHPAWRAVDVRDRDIHPEAVDDLTSFLNQQYVYDRTRTWLTVCYSKPHGSGPHVHIQAHMNTARRKPETFTPKGGTFGGAGASGSF